MNTKKFPFSREHLLNHFTFNYEKGLILYKQRTFGKPSKLVGQKMFNTVCGNYLIGGFEGKYYAAHRIIFFAYYNEEPIAIDHKDRNTHNNSITNLVGATNRTNAYNTPLFSENIHRNASGTYKVRLYLNGKMFSLGSYNSYEEAITVRNNFIKEQELDTVKLL